MRTRTSIGIILCLFFLIGCFPKQDQEKGATAHEHDQALHFEESGHEPDLGKGVTVHEHTQTLRFEESGHDTPVFATPLEENEVYVIQAEDVVEVSHVLEYVEQGVCYIRVSIPSRNIKEGYIQINKNPYKDGGFSLLETIAVDGTDVDVLRYSDSFAVSDGVVMRELPSETAGAVHEITHEEGYGSYETNAITADYSWVRIVVGEWEGWIPANSLSRNRGGPLIETPEVLIEWWLITSNYI